MPTFTKEISAIFNGRHGKPCYVAHKGLVYDVAESFHWKDGIHWVFHEGGCDVTAEMNAAPHFDTVLVNFTVIGVRWTDLHAGPDPRRISTNTGWIYQPNRTPRAVCSLTSMGALIV